MRKSVIIGHQGYGDLFSLNAIYNFYSKKYSECIIFAKDADIKIVFEATLHHRKNIKIEIPILIDWFIESNETCIYCHQNGSLICPRQGDQICKIIDYDFYLIRNYDVIKIGAFNNYLEWSNFLKQERSVFSSFSHCFYKYQNLDPNIRLDSFLLSRNTEAECFQYDNLKVTNKSSKFIVVHDDVKRNLKISFLLKFWKYFFINKYRLNGVSQNMIDQIKILENAEEIHFIDSSYSVMIYFLSFQNERIKQIPKFLHTLNRTERDINIYLNPTPSNWTVL